MLSEIFDEELYSLKVRHSLIEKIICQYLREKGLLKYLASVKIARWEFRDTAFLGSVWRYGSHYIKINVMVFAVSQNRIKKTSLPD